MPRGATLARGEQGPIAPESDLAFDSDLVEEGILHEDGTDDDGEFYPQRWYNAGNGATQERILLSDRGDKVIAPVRGAYTINSPEERTTLLKALGGKVWQEDLPRTSPDMVCPNQKCASRFRSTQAFQAHLNTCHPRQ